MPDNRPYLDGCLTVTAFKSNKYLKDIQAVRGGIKINCNAGAVSTNLRRTYGWLKVWYLPDGIADIFSMHELKKAYRITYDSWYGYYIVHTPKGEVQFYKDKQGLPYINMEKSNKAVAMTLLQQEKWAFDARKSVLETEVLFIQTIQGNYEGFTKCEVTKAKKARRAQAMMRTPSEKDYKGMVSNNRIANCPITLSIVSNACAIFGPDLASIRGKTVQRTSAPVVADYMAVPRELVDSNKVITLAADVFFIDGMACLLMVSRRIKFVTAEHVPVRTVLRLSKHLKRVLNVYGRAGFRVSTILMDGMPTIECNTTVAKEHVSKAKRTIRKAKERTRGLLVTLPFACIPKQMKIDCVYFMVLWMIAFPVKSGISQTFLPWELLVQWRLDYKKHCPVPPGTYGKMHDEPVPTNTMTWRTHKGIALGLTGNLQESVKLYCINMGHILKRQSFTPMPMPDRVIKCVNAIGQQEGQGRKFRFTNCWREPYAWTDEVPEDNPEFQGLLKNDEEMALNPDISADLPGVELEEDE